MKYNLAIYNYKRMMIAFIILLAVNFVIASFVALAMMKKVPYEFTVTPALVFFCFSMFIMLKLFLYNEALYMDKYHIKSKKFGIMTFENITKYRTSYFRGGRALVLYLKNGNKVVIGPRMDITGKSLGEFLNFREELKKYCS